MFALCVMRHPRGRACGAGCLPLFCHLNNPLIRHSVPPSLPPRGKALRAISRSEQVFSSVLLQTLVISQNIILDRGCHAITSLLYHFRPIHALRGPGHSRKAASRHRQVFSSVLLQTLVISLTPILDRGESPHRRLFGTFSSLEKVHIPFLCFFLKEKVVLLSSK